MLVLCFFLIFMNHRRNTMKLSLTDVKKRIISLTSSTRINMPKEISENDNLNKKIQETNSVNSLPGKKRSLLKLLFGQRFTNSNTKISKNVCVDQKVNLNILKQQHRGSGNKSTRSGYSKIKKDLNGKAIREHKCCSSCCTKLDYSAHQRSSRTRGHGNRQTRRINYVRSAVCSSISKQYLEIGKPDATSKYFEGDFNAKTKSENKTKVSKMHDSSHQKNKFVCTNTSRLLYSTPANGNKQRNSLALMDYKRSSLSYHDNVLQKYPFRQSTFYAMNMQVQNYKKRKYKLEPHECEPGICIPGQCDPIECEKLIRKRLMKRSSTMTSTKIRSQSMSSETVQSRSVSQSQGHEGKRHRRDPKSKAVTERRGVQYQTIPRYETVPKHEKQAVSIGSSFSFNIEFSKNRTDNKIHSASSPRRKRGSVSSTGTSWDEKRLKAQGTPGYKIRSQNEGSQSNLRGYNKGSMMRLKHKRCFCTLELKRRELHHKGISINMKGIPPRSITMMTSGQNTKNINTYTGRRLEPYECEPNVCIPGECDPYQCLERIKKRSRGTKDFNAGNYSSNASVSSMTSSRNNKGKHAQRTQKVRENKKKQKFIPEQTSQLMFNAPFKSNINSTRQAVRIDSNFSFSVEIFKDKTFHHQPFMTLNPTKQRPRTKSENTITHEHRAQASEKSIQDSTQRRNRDEQAQSRTKNKGTKAIGLLERCFCTAKLFSAHLKSRRDTKSPKQKPKNASYTGTFSQTDKIKKTHPRIKNAPTLEPYECEPGICVPGQCDPYECDMLIKKRLNRDFGTSTPKKNVRIQSMTTDTNRANIIKNQDSQSQKPKRRDSRDSKLMKTQPQRIVEKPRFPMIHPNYWQGVKIGSNVSLNIEFYKELKTPGNGLAFTNGNVKTRYLRGKDQNVSTIYDTKRGLKKGTNTLSKSIDSNMQAGQFTESKASASGKALKRCFCTAKLHQPGIKSHSKQSVIVGRVETNHSTPFKPQINTKRLTSTQCFVTDSPKTKNKFTNSKKPKSREVKISDELCAGDKSKKCHTGCKFVKAGKNTKQDMETILPYEPKKFKKQNKKVTFNLTNKKDVRVDHECYNSESNRNAKLVHTKAVSRKNRLAFLKCFFRENKATADEKVPSFTEIEIKGKRLKNDVCVPKYRKNSTIVTVSGSYVACDITQKIKHSKQAAGDTASNTICTATCGPCKNKIGEKPTVNIAHFRGLAGKNENKQLTGKNGNKQTCPCIRASSHKEPSIPKVCPCAAKKINVIKKESALVTKKQKEHAKVTHGDILKKTVQKGECTCGISVCRKASKKEKKARKHLKSKKPCTCGSKVCKLESAKKAKKEAFLRDKTCRQRLIMKLQKQEEKEMKRREKYTKEDIIRFAKRQASDKRTKARIKRAKFNDPLLLGQSLFDVGKLGLVTTSDVARSTVREIRNPVTASKSLKTAILKPSICCARCKEALYGSGATSTFTRILYRFSLMQSMRAIKSALESNLITAYLMHMFDRNPKKKKKIAKLIAKKQAEEARRRKRMEVDFNCSPFMNSLRTRPCLRVYHMCPWFYPHCLSLLILWRQFTELALFLLAIIVWCPLILCLETFRMFVCCCLCTA